MILVHINVLAGLRVVCSDVYNVSYVFPRNFREPQPCFREISSDLTEVRQAIWPVQVNLFIHYFLHNLSVIFFQNMYQVNLYFLKSVYLSLIASFVVQFHRWNVIFFRTVHIQLAQKFQNQRLMGNESTQLLMTFCTQGLEERLSEALRAKKFSVLNWNRGLPRQ